MKKIYGILFIIFILNFLSAQAITGAAITVDADYKTIYPGEQESITIDIENNMDYDLEEVSVSLILDSVPFTTVGSSEREIDELDEGDSENVRFLLRASTDITPGDYNIPYEITYYDDKENLTTKTGSFGIRVSAKTNLDFSIETKNEIIGEQGKISLKIVNKGLGQVKFISVEVFPQGYELLSSKKVYIGTIGSDEDDLASFDVIFRSENPQFSARVEYNDFENEQKIETINLPVKVYTREKAIELGLIKESKTTIYLVIAAIIVFLWIIWGRIKKRRRKNNKDRR